MGKKKKKFASSPTNPSPPVSKPVFSAPPSASPSPAAPAGSLLSTSSAPVGRSSEPPIGSGGSAPLVVDPPSQLVPQPQSKDPLLVASASTPVTADSPSFQLQCDDSASSLPCSSTKPPDCSPAQKTPLSYANVLRGSPSQVPSIPESSPSLPRSKWLDIIHCPSKKLTRKGTAFLLDSGEQCVSIENEIIKRNHHKWDSFILGQFHGNLPSHGALHAIFNGIWSNRLRDITVSRLGTRSVLIRIPNPVARAKVLSQGMWSIQGQTMFVADWNPGFNLSLPEISEVPVWLEFRDVPPQFFSEEALERIASLVGHPVMLHPSTENLTNLEVAKVLTIIDPSKDLPCAVNAKFDSGEICRIRVACPWLPPLCTHCKERGHSIKLCPTAPVLCETCKSICHLVDVCPRMLISGVSRPAKRERQKVKGLSQVHYRVKITEPIVVENPNVLPVVIQDTILPAIETISQDSPKAVDTEKAKISELPKVDSNGDEKMIPQKSSTVAYYGSESSLASSTDSESDSDSNHISSSSESSLPPSHRLRTKQRFISDVVKGKKKKYKKMRAPARYSPLHIK